jgi:hypothetical protein
MTLNRDLGIAAVFLLLAGAGGAALAHPHPDGDGSRKVERVVIIHDGEGGGHEGKGERVRRFEMHGAGGLANCDGGEKIVDESSGDGDRKTKIIICRKGAPTAATAKHLEEALARIHTNDHLSDEQKAKIETALRSAIDRARGTR